MVLHWIQTHLGFVALHACETCSQSFASAERLQAHRQQQHYPWGSHPGPGPRYLCNRCAGMLDSRDELAVHQYHVHGMTHPL